MVGKASAACAFHETGLICRVDAQCKVVTTLVHSSLLEVALNFSAVLSHLFADETAGVH